MHCCLGLGVSKCTCSLLTEFRSRQVFALLRRFRSKQVHLLTVDRVLKLKLLKIMTNFRNFKKPVAEHHSAYVEENKI